MPPTTHITILGVVKLESLLWEQQTLENYTKRTLLYLISKLAFAAKAIPVGTIFTCRLIDTSTYSCLLHHHIHLSATTHADISWWLTFAEGWNGKAFFVNLPWTLPRHSSYSLVPVTRVSVPTGPHGVLTRGRGTSANAWGKHWSHKCLFIHCDNQAVVHVWHTGTTGNIAGRELATFAIVQQRKLGVVSWVPKGFVIIH